MKDKFENLMQKARFQGGLTTKEKARLRINLETLILTHPVNKPVFSGWTILIRQHVFVSAFVAVLLFVGAGSAIAEGSLPGNFFYKFKTGVNEQVLGWLAFSGEGKSEWQLSLAERRLKEIEALAQKDELSVDEEARLNEKFDFYTSAALGGEIAIGEPQQEKTPNPDTSRSATLKTSENFESGVSLMMAAEPALEIDQVLTTDEKEAESTLSPEDISLFKKQLSDKKKELFKNKNRKEIIRLRVNILLIEKQLISATLSLKRGDNIKARASFDKANQIFSLLLESKPSLENDGGVEKIEVFQGSTTQVEVYVPPVIPGERKETSPSSTNESGEAQDTTSNSQPTNQETGNQKKETSTTEVKLPVEIDVNLGL